MRQYIIGILLASEIIKSVKEQCIGTRFKEQFWVISDCSQNEIEAVIVRDERTQTAEPVHCGPQWTCQLVNQRVHICRIPVDKVFNKIK
jgi:hypothetical protein